MGLTSGFYFIVITKNATLKKRRVVLGKEMMVKSSAASVLKQLDAAAEEAQF